MDDPEMESEDSSADGGGKMNWMLDKGLMLGKKALLTGILISSAPFVIPQLVVFSALGLAFSVPSGLAVASYACTEKIMSKLLPMPNPPQMVLEEISRDDEEDEILFGGEIDSRKAEELMGDTKSGVEVRTEFVDVGNGELTEEKFLVESNDLGSQCILKDEVAIPVIESGYKENVEDDLPKKDQQPLGDFDMGVEESKDGKVRRLVVVFEKNASNVEEIMDEQPVNEIYRVVVKVDETGESIREGEIPIQVTTKDDIVNENDLAAETTGLLERIRDENESMEEADQQGEGIPEGNQDETSENEIERVVVEVEKTDVSVREGDTPTQVTAMDDITNEKQFAAETTGLLERIRDENKSMEEAEQQGKGIPGGNQVETGFDSFQKAEKPMNAGFEAVGVASILEDEQRLIVCERTTLVIGGMDVAEDIPFDLRKENVIPSNADIREIANESGFDLFDHQNAAGGNQDETGFDNILEAEKPMNVGFEALGGRSILEEEQRPIVCEKTGSVIGGVDVTEDVPSDLMEENAVSSNADIKEIADESGFDLFDDQTASADQYPHRVANVPTGLGSQNGGGFSPKSKVFSEKDNTAKSNEGLGSEEKIWERIMTMRAIVGYKAPASKTFAEELKALYMFTGVEPPSSSFKDSSDLVEVSSRLQFLMSIVGVK